MSSLDSLQFLVWFAFISVAFLGGGLWVSYFIRPSHPSTDKLESYESGEEPTGHAWGRVSPAFYTVALVFILFEVELVFLFPWALTIADASVALEAGVKKIYFTEALIFIGILALGLMYCWKKGYLEWIKSSQIPTDFKGIVPQRMYDDFNNSYSNNEKK